MMTVEALPLCLEVLQHYTLHIHTTAPREWLGTMAFVYLL